MAVKTNEILIGSKENPILSLDNDNIISVNGNLACDLLCETIPVDTLEIQCRYDRMQLAFSPIDYNGMRTSAGKQVYARSALTDDVLNIPYASGLWYYNGGSYIGKFYVVDAQRTGKTVYIIKAKSAMGILDTLSYYGKLFVNAPLLEVLKNVILTDGMEATETPFLTELAESIALGAGLDTVTVTGWIPVCTKREALHHVLFAHGVNILKAENDSFLITRISNTLAGRIDPNNEYDSGSVALTERVKSVEVTEHAYVQSPNTESVVLYDNTENSIDLETRVVFDSAPIVLASLTVSGTLEILAANENCAIVSGVGTLTGIPYTHTTNVISRINGSNADGQSISVFDATLVNTINSNAVADRLYAYYSTKRDMQIPIVLSGEKCGMQYTCTTPFGDEKEAFIVSMSITASAIAKAGCKMISGYEPPERPGELTHLVVLTGSGVFKVPQDVLEADNPRIRLVLIGGGQGGQGGGHGQDGKEMIVAGAENLAQPGEPGKNGNPGKIYMLQIDGPFSEKEYSYSCGSGGKGSIGHYHDEAPYDGALGEPTTFGEYSSDSGNIPVSGFLDPTSGSVYGGPSPDFSGIMRSGRGGGTVTMTTEDGFRVLALPPESGVVVLNEKYAASYGGKPGDILELDGGKGATSEGSLNGPYLGVTGGGSGGPIPVHTRADYYYPWDGKPASVSGNVITLGDGGCGFDGLDAPSPLSLSKTAYGQGGIGGHGGPGAGSSGFLTYKMSGYTVVDGNINMGGRGGHGSDGAPGCILVYY